MTYPECPYCGLATPADLTAHQQQVHGITPHADAAYQHLAAQARQPERATIWVDCPDGCGQQHRVAADDYLAYLTGEHPEQHGSAADSGPYGQYL